MATKKASPRKTVETLTHGDATRKNIPTAEYQSVLEPRKRDPVAVRYPRGGAGLDEEKAARNTELDPQLVWRGKDRQDEGDLVVQAPPLYIRRRSTRIRTTCSPIRRKDGRRRRRSGEPRRRRRVRCPPRARRAPVSFTSACRTSR